MSRGYFMEWQPYVSVATKLANARRHAAELARKQKRQPQPVALRGRAITTTFWGQAWCDNLESYSDYANRLDRGARYVRNGSVVDLVIAPCSIEAVVAGSHTYTVEIEIDPLRKGTWSEIISDCSHSIDSLLDLLAGQFSEGIMKRLTRQKGGLFPSPQQIRMACSCPDWSNCCKHLAAVMYGVGARLDHQPELLFHLRKVDHNDLVTKAVAKGNLDRELTAGRASRSLANEDLGAIFGIELESKSPAKAKGRPETIQRATTKTPTSKRGKGSAAKKSAKSSSRKPAKKSKRATPVRSKARKAKGPSRKSPRSKKRTSA